MNQNFQNDLNLALVKFITVLLKVDPVMNKFNEIVHEKFQDKEDDINIFVNIHNINIISNNLTSCYNTINYTCEKINSCTKKLKNYTNNQLDEFILDYPRFINNYMEKISTHIDFIEKLTIELNNWIVNNKFPQFIVEANLKMFDYTNKLEDNATFIIKITETINEIIENN